MITCHDIIRSQEPDRLGVTLVVGDATVNRPGGGKVAKGKYVVGVYVVG